MFTIIFGRSGCSFCVRAKELAEKLKHQRNDFDYNYIDIQAEKITKMDLAIKTGRRVETVPQIFIDEEYIGGYTDFESYAKEKLLS